MKLWHNPSKSSAPPKPTLPGQGIFYLIAASGILISFILWYAIVMQTHTNLRHIIQLHAEHVANDIHLQFEVRISALKHLAKHLEKSPTYSEWESNVKELLENYSGLESAASIDPSLKPHWMYPDGNLADQNLYSNFLTQYATTLKDLVQHPQIWISPGVKSASGEAVVFIVVPVISANAIPQGFLVSIVSLKKVFNEQFTSPNYTTDIYDNGQKLYAFEPNHPSNVLSPSVEPLALYGANWQIFVKPSETLVNNVENFLPYVTLLLGMFIGVLLAILYRLAQLVTHRSQSLKVTKDELNRQVAERHQAEASKQQLEKALLQGQKLQAIGTLAGGIAHDFNNILYAIMGFAEMAQEDIAKAGEPNENLKKVLEASHRGQEIISRILTFGRRHHPDFSLIQVRATIDNVLSLLKPTIPASVTIRFIVNITGDCTIMGNQTQLHQVIVNIINNAVDAMDGEGTITIKLDRVSADNALLKQFPDVHSTSYCKIEISDTGYGMDQSTIERIFEPFYTTKEVGKGTGLGLATVHAIIKEHQGETLVTSQIGHGSTFSLFIPEYSTAEKNRGK